MELRDYQWEVIQPALEGKNIIIWLPTGAGKTRAAAYVCKRHLESQRNSKVAVLVNMVPLVDQHFKNEFSALQHRFNVTSISGDSSQKFFFSEVVKSNDLIICTAQILQNALNSQDEEMHVELTDFSLLVIDECHHTHKETTYNKIMEVYLEHKLKGQQKLPQILGLTASLGTGGANTLEGAQEHILQICANLDTAKIMSADRNKFYIDHHVPQPKKQYDLSEQRPLDPFGKKLKDIMSQIYTYLNVLDLTMDFGTQSFEQRIVELEKEGAKAFCRKIRVCALHLRKYNDALLINDTVRMIDAFKTLDEFYQQETYTKTLQDPTECYLTQLFTSTMATIQSNYGTFYTNVVTVPPMGNLWEMHRAIQSNRQHFLTLAEDERYENPRLHKLHEVLQNQFEELRTSRGIVFTRTRQCAHSLLLWIEDNQVLLQLGIKASVLTGAGTSNQTKHMTQNEQQNVIQLFRSGALNLLFSTSVAEEGLDIPECNIVVRYGLMTNEIAMVQARGRARAPNSICSVLAKTHSKEVTREKRNELMEDLMEKAIEWVQEMPEQEYHQKIRELQYEAVHNCRLRDANRKQQRLLHIPHDVRFYCINCNQAVCHGSDLRTIEKTHHININRHFRLYYKTSPDNVAINRQFKEWRPGRSISCQQCGQVCLLEGILTSTENRHLCVSTGTSVALQVEMPMITNNTFMAWGMEMIYREVTLPMLAIKYFVVEDPNGRKTYKKWSKITFDIQEFDYIEYCTTNFLLDDM